LFHKAVEGGNEGAHLSFTAGGDSPVPADYPAIQALANSAALKGLRARQGVLTGKKTYQFC
jgi:hypothetical protein